MRFILPGHPYGQARSDVTYPCISPEREILVERTKVGLDAARARGKVGGRKRSLTYKQREQVMKIYRSKSMTIKDIALTFGVSEPTIYRTISEMKASSK